MTGPGRAAAIGDVVVLVGALALALTPLGAAYGSALITPVAGGLVVGAAVAVLADQRRWGAAVTSALGVVAYLLLAVVMGVAPATPAGLGRLLAATVTVWKEVLTWQPPLGGGHLVVAPLLLALVGSLGAATLALRGTRVTAPAASAVPVGVLVIAVLLGTGRPVAPVGVGVALGVGLLVRTAWRRGSLDLRRLPAILVVGALAASLGAALGPVLAEPEPRFVLRERVVPPFEPAEQASPLASFRRFVKEWHDQPLLTAHGLPADTPVRLATMDVYDGIVWRVAGEAGGSGAFRRVGDRVPVSEPGSEVTVGFEVHHLPFVWLPTVGYARSFSIDGAPGARAADLATTLRYSDATGAAVLVDGVPDGTSWTVTAVVPERVDVQDVGAAPVASGRLPDVVVPEAVRDFATQAAGAATSPVLIAEALEAALHGRGWLSHGLTERGEHPSLSGHGSDRLTTLLTAEPMVGDDEQYAAAMALAARQMGLPARVVLGFVAPPDAGSVVTFTGADVAAWVEVDFVGHGWVAFHPTPDRALTADDDRPADEAEPRPQVVQPPPVPEDPIRVQDDDPEQAGLAHDGDLSGLDSRRRARLVTAVVAAAAFVLVVPAGTILAIKQRRRRRRRAGRDAVAQVIGGWDELLDHAADLRHPAPVRATRREVALALAERFRSRRLGTAIRSLAVGTDEVVFGPGGPSAARAGAHWAEVDAAVAAMRREMPLGRRVGARVSTRSLRRRRGRRR